MKAPGVRGSFYGLGCPKRTEAGGVEYVGVAHGFQLRLGLARAVAAAAVDDVPGVLRQLGDRVGEGGAGHVDVHSTWDVALAQYDAAGNIVLAMLFLKAEDDEVQPEFV